MIKGKGKAVPLQALTGPWGFRRLGLPEFLDNRHLEKVVRLSALRTGHLYPPPPGKDNGHSFFLEAESTPGRGDNNIKIILKQIGCEGIWHMIGTNGGFLRTRVLQNFINCRYYEYTKNYEPRTSYCTSWSRFQR